MKARLFCLLINLALGYGAITVADVRDYAMHAGEELYKYEAHQPGSNLTELIHYLHQHKPAISSLHHLLRIQIGDLPAVNFSRPLLAQYDLLSVATSERLFEEFASRALCYAEQLCTEAVHYGDSGDIASLAHKHRTTPIQTLIQETDQQIYIVMHNQTVFNQTLVDAIVASFVKLTKLSKDALAEAQPIVRRVQEQLTAHGGQVLREESRHWVETELPWFQRIIDAVDAYQRFFHDSLLGF